MQIYASRTLVCARLAMARPATAAAGRKGSHFLGQRLVWKAAVQQRMMPGRRDRSVCVPVRASFFGVGAPEALLVGVVALVLFGPKGLAQAVKSLGETLKTFAPTIRELTQVSTELKSTLEEEIGLNDLRDELQRPMVPTPRPAKPVAEISSDVAAAEEEASTSTPLSELSAGMQQMDDSMAKVIDPEIERRREEAARMAWGGAAAAAPAQVTAPMADMSIEELEKELQRRKAAASGGQDGAN